MRKKISIILILLLSIFIFSGCSKSTIPQKIQNETMVNGFYKTNTYLLKNPGTIQGQVVINLDGSANFKGSTVKVDFTSDNVQNKLSYSGSLSVETIGFILSKIFNNNSFSMSGLNINLASFENHFNLTPEGNYTGNFIKFKSDVLTPLYKGNNLYLSEANNRVAFGERLNNLITDSKVEVLPETKTSKALSERVTTLKISGNDLLSIIPIINFSAKELNNKVTIKTYQNVDSDLITKIDIELFKYNISDNGGNLNFDANIKLTLNLINNEVK